MKNHWLDRRKKKQVNKMFLAEAAECAVRWAKNGLLDGINRLWSRGQSAVMLESQRLWNECPFAVRIRTKKTMHMHGFKNEKELYAFLDMHTGHSGMQGVTEAFTFGWKEDQEPKYEWDTIITVFFNSAYNERQILVPGIAGGEWLGYDKWHLDNGRVHDYKLKMMTQMVHMFPQPKDENGNYIPIFQKDVI